MKITGFEQNNNYRQSFGAGLDVITSAIQSKARWSAFHRDEIKATSDKFEARIAKIKNLHPNYYISAALENNKHTIGDFYRFSLVPSHCNKSCAKFLKDIKADTPALVVMAQLERALRKFKP